MLGDLLPSTYYFQDGLGQALLLPILTIISMMEATLIHTNSNGRPMIHLKLYDDVVVHAFTIKGIEAEYSVSKRRGELIAHGTVEVIDLQSKGEYITSMTVRTQAYDFEVRPGPNYTYIAYKTLLERKKSVTGNIIDSLI